MEVYDPRAESWSFVAPLQTARRGAGVTHHDGKFLAAGWLVEKADIEYKCCQGIGHHACCFK